MSTITDLQQENLERMARTASLDKARASVSGNAREDTRTSVSTDSLTGESSPEDLTADTHALVPVRKGVRKSARTDGFLDAVEESLESRRILPSGVKATVDMSVDLSDRAKRYLVDHRGRSLRQVMIELLDAYLSAKGY